MLRGLMSWTESFGAGSEGVDSISRNFTNISEKDCNNRYIEILISNYTSLHKGESKMKTELQESVSWKLGHMFPVEESFITSSDAINVYPCPSAAAANMDSNVWLWYFFCCAVN